MHRKPRSNLCTPAFHRSDSRDPDVHVLDGWMPATKHTPSMHHRRRRNVTTSMDGLKNGHILKNLTKNGEPQRSSWWTQKMMMMKKKKKGRLEVFTILHSGRSYRHMDFHKGHRYLERYMHANNQSYLLQDGQQSEWFHVKTEVRHGCMGFSYFLSCCHLLGDEESHRRTTKRTGMGSYSPVWRLRLCWYLLWHTQKDMQEKTESIKRQEVFWTGDPS